MPISVREFRAHLSRYLAGLKRGQVLEIARHKRVIARVVPAGEARGSGLDALLASGAAEWRGGKPRGAAVRLRDRGNPVSSLVLQDRE